MSKYKIRKNRKMFELLAVRLRQNSQYPDANYENSGYALAGVSKTQEGIEEIKEKLIRKSQGI